MLSNIINYNNDYRIIFEPFKHERLKFVEHLVYPTYIYPNNSSAEIINPMQKIFGGKIRSWWTDKPNEKLFSSKRLVKAIRTNLMLEWIKKNYSEIPIILLIRNPFAAIESWMRADWGYLNPKKRTFEQRELLEPLLPENTFDRYEAAKGALFNHFYNWCINYYVPLKTFRNNEAYITFYESYLENPSVEVKKLFSFLNKPFKEKALSKLNELSFTTRKDSPLRKGENTILSWKKKYTKEQIISCMDILSEFKLDGIYDYCGSGLPQNNIKNW